MAASATEYRTVIFNAARDGNLQRLKVFLSMQSKDEVQALLSARTFGTPPLVIASRNGHIDVVKFLLSQNMTVEMRGTVIFDGETVEGAPPLWCASAAGHLEIVDLLVTEGCANVNSTTKTNSTPLRAACFDGHLNIVKYLLQHGADPEISNRHGHTSLMIACYRGHVDVVKYLIEIGANVNRKSLKGNTALHDCAESGSLDIMNLLLEKGASMEMDAFGLTPLLSAAVIGNAGIVNFLINKPNLLSVSEKVDGLEILGATYVDKKRNFVAAIKVWRNSLTFRQTASVRPKKPSPTPAYGNQIEFRNESELDAIRADPDAIRMQALLIRERILGPAHPDTSYYIRYRGAVYADVGEFVRCFELWRYALDMQQLILEPLCALTQSSFVSFAELFAFMLSETTSGLPNSAAIQNAARKRVSFVDIFPVVRAAVAEIKRGLTAYGSSPLTYEFGIIFPDKEHNHDSSSLMGGGSGASDDGTGSPALLLSSPICPHAGGESQEQQKNASLQRMCSITLHLNCLAAKMEAKMTPEDHDDLRQLMYELVRLDPRSRTGLSLLHMACSAETSAIGRHPVCRFPALNVVQSMLACGADPNAIDQHGNSPLHSVMFNKIEKQSIVDCLLESGGHIDARNHDGVRVLDLLSQSKDITVTPHQYLSLQCLAAEAVLEYQLGWRGVIPRHLERFMEIH